MDKKLRDNRDCLFTLLMQMGAASGEEPRIVDLSELNFANKMALLASWVSPSASTR